MKLMTDPRTRLATGIEERISDLGMEYQEVARRAGFSIETLAKIRQGKRARPTTLRKLETALNWPPGYTDSLMSGDPLTPPEGPLLVPAGGTPKPEQGDPVMYIKDTPPLEPGEELTAWQYTDGHRWHRFTKTDEEGHSASISAPYPSGLSLEAVAETMRASANAALRRALG